MNVAVIRWYRSAQPPANVFNPSGVNIDHVFTLKRPSMMMALELIVSLPGDVTLLVLHDLVHTAGVSGIGFKLGGEPGFDQSFHQVFAQQIA